MVLEAFGFHQADFTSSPSLALIMVLTFGVWQFFGENVILYLAAWKSLPVDLLLEAASVDGAGGMASLPVTSAGRCCAALPRVIFVITAR